ncbi:helix-turn-helix transcriptional regulator [Ralstonia soli]|uniref:Helix-turn-helix transcriptional regulator n=1 Tax=Ralstonia soli TaxID=2953896 RepID=A0ABT1AMA3_9RALS|nr:helix-turn-helix transcriptional regulator [Ralstonia soli]MCO5399533.1 helix-turn-helix transcriptional regulator [Ralstonia soli]
MLKDQLIGDLYEAAVTQDGFLEAFQQVTESLGADMFHMFSWDAVRNAPQLSVYSPKREIDDTIRLYDQYYGALDPRRGFVERANVREFAFCQDHLSDVYVERSEFFQDYQIPAGFRYLMGVRLERPGSSDILLGMLRAHGRTPYSEENRFNAAGMAGHLQRTINLWRDTRVLHRDAAIGAELMEQLGLAVFALGRDQRVLFANAQAEALLRASTCLRLEHGRLCATFAADNDGLQAALARVAKTRKGESVTVRPRLGAPHEIFLGISQLPAHAAHAAFGDAAMLITARRRGDAAPVTAMQLRQAFGLSAAEAAVGEALIAGKTPDEYAASAGVAMSTVRSQLRAIYEKTCTRSQTEAVGTMLWVLSQRKPQG